MERYVKPRRGLPAVRMGDHKVAGMRFREFLHILEIADHPLLRIAALQQWRLRRGDGRRDSRAHLVQHAGEIEQQVRLGADRKSAATDMKMRIEHCVGELSALSPI